MLTTRDPDVARRLGWSQGMVREVRRLAGESGRSRNAARPHNPWLSNAGQWPAVRTETFADALGRAAQAASRSERISASATGVLAAATFLMDVGFLTPWRGASLLREVAFMLQGMMDATGKGAPLSSSEEQFVVPSGWTVKVNCPHGAYWGYGVLGGTITDRGCDRRGGVYPAPPPNGWIFNNHTAPSLLVQNQTVYATCNASYTPGSSLWEERSALLLRWEAPTVGAVPDLLPHTQPGAVHFASARGLASGPGAPIARGSAAQAMDAVKALMLPNMPLPSLQPSPKAVEAAQEVREGLGLREEVQPAPAPSAGQETAPGVLPGVDPFPSPGWEPQVVPGLAVETAGKGWKLSRDKHVYKNQPLRTKKLKVVATSAAMAAAFVANMFTESNDAVNAIWEALPRSKRTAGLTKTGNRRTDRMLADIMRGFDSIDWHQAAANLVANQVEDAIIGRWARFENAQSLGSGPGAGTIMGRVREGAGNPLDFVTEGIKAQMPRITRAVF